MIALFISHKLKKLFFKALEICVMKRSFNIEIIKKKSINVAVFADENKSIMLQPLREKQKDHVTNKYCILHYIL